MTDTKREAPDVVTESEWKDALDAQAERENALFDKYEEIKTARRQLPMTEVTEPFIFAGPDGETSLADVFDGQRYLILYHFMYAPEWERGCPMCTSFVNGLGPTLNTDLNEQGVQFALTSRAPSDKLEAYKAEKGWTFPWYSAPREFSEYIGVIDDDAGDFPGISVFYRGDDGRVYRTYSAGRAAADVIPFMGFMNFTPLGASVPG